MTLNEYQKLAMRTSCIPEENKKDMLRHAVFGLCSEVGELAQLIEESRPNLLIDIEHFKKELGDCCWMIAEAATAIDENMFDLKVLPDANHYFTRDISSAVLYLGYRAGIVAGLLQKEYQGHELKSTDVSIALGECLRIIILICNISNIDLANVLQLNIDKLRARFPEGFEVDKSLHRAEGDV